MNYRTKELRYTPRDRDEMPVTPDNTPVLRVTVKGVESTPTVTPVQGSYLAYVTPDSGNVHEWEWTAMFEGYKQDVRRGRFTPEPR